tara:strand:- start:679 stop:1161 length:483 start_codon:yes stop_codon:yes gene_type:complete
MMNESNVLYYAKPWEIFICIVAFLSLVLWMVISVPSVSDENVYSVDDVIVSYRCFSGGKSDYVKFIGASGRKYSVGARKGDCRNSKDKFDFVGKNVTAYFVDGGDEIPIQLDIDGIEGYEGGVTYNLVIMVTLIAASLIFFPFFVFLVARQKKEREQKTQ